MVFELDEYRVVYKAGVFNQYRVYRYGVFVEGFFTLAEAKKYICDCAGVRRYLSAPAFERTK